MLHLTITGASELADWARQAAAKTRGAIMRGVTKGALLVEARAKKIVYQGHPEHLKSGTGHLRQSLTHELQPSNLLAYVGTNVKYAAIHEFGGEIKPQGHPFLAIPVGDMKGSPRDHEELRFQPTAKGGVLLDKADKLQYVLRRSVTIPARPYIGPALQEEGPKIKQAIENALLREIMPR